MGSIPPPGERLDRDALGVAIEIADEAIAGRRMSRAQYAELLAQVYEALQEGWPIGGLVPYARALADEMTRSEAKPPPMGFPRLRAV
jgi:hypothetical protein